MASQQVKIIADLSYNGNTIINNTDTNNARDSSLNSASDTNFIGKILNNSIDYLDMSPDNCHYIGRLENSNIYPSRIRVILDREYISRLGSYIAIFYNDIKIGEEYFASNITTRGFLEFVLEINEDSLEIGGPSAQDKFEKVFRSKTSNENFFNKDINFDHIRIYCTGNNTGTVRIRDLQVFFENDDNKVFNITESVTTPTIEYFYPVLCSGNLTSSSGNFNNYKDYVNTPSNTSGYDNKYIECLDPNTSYIYNSTNNRFFQIDSNFNISGSKPIDKCFLNIRYKNNKTGENYSDAISVLGTTSDTNYSGVILWGGGQRYHTSTSGFLISSTELYFQKNKLPDRYYANQSYLNNLKLRIVGLPSGTQISSMELATYSEPYNSINFFTKSDYGVNNNNIDFINNGYIDSINSLNLVEIGNESFVNNILFNTKAVNPTGFHSIDFYTSAGVFNKSLDLFVRNEDKQQSFDLYLLAHQETNNYINFIQLGEVTKSIDMFITGHIENSGLFPLYTNNANSLSSGFNFHMINIPNINDNLSLYTEGLTPEFIDNNINFNIYSSNISGIYNTTPFNTKSDFDSTYSIPLYINSIRDDRNATINFYERGKIDSEKNINLFLHNRISGVGYGFKMQLNAAKQPDHYEIINMTIGTVTIPISGSGVGFDQIGYNFMVGNDNLNINNNIGFNMMGISDSFNNINFNLISINSSGGIGFDQIGSTFIVS
jgi:hypothetical protein